MSDYTLDMFCKDHDEMYPILKALRDVRLPKDEWPRIISDGGLYRLNPNNSIYDTIGFFTAKYGQPKARDYATRFLSTIWFINDNLDALTGEGLVKEDPSGADLIRGELLQVMLDSFNPPQLPGVFPTTPLGNKHHTFSLARVLKAVKPLIQD